MKNVRYIVLNDWVDTANKNASSRLCDLTHRDFKGFQGR